MSIAEWCNLHQDVVVSISNPRSIEGYKTVVWMEDSGHRYEVSKELVGIEPASEGEVVEALDELYLELKEKQNA